MKPRKIYLALKETALDDTFSCKLLDEKIAERVFSRWNRFSTLVETSVAGVSVEGKFWSERITAQKMHKLLIAATQKIVGDRYKVVPKVITDKRSFEELMEGMGF